MVKRLLLTKRTPGTPLSEAELRQRRDAARARWRAAGLGVGAGAAGAATGAIINAAREGLFHASAVERTARTAGITGLHQLQAIRRSIVARQLAVRQAIEAAYLHQLRATEPKPTRSLMQVLGGSRSESEINRQVIDENHQRRRSGLPDMTPDEQAWRKRELAQNTRGPTRPAFAERPIIGNVKNKLIYTRQLAQAKRRLNTVQRWRDRLVQANIAAGEDPEFADEGPKVRAANIEIRHAKREVDELTALQQRASRPTARSGHEKTVKGKKHGVSATVAHQFRGGETIPKLNARIAAERALVRDKMGERLALVDRHTASMVASAERRTIDQTAAAIAEMYTTGAIRSRILKASGRGALIGAVAGLTAAGVTALGYHVATAGHRKSKPRVEKLDEVFEELLAKARKPEDDMAIRQAQVYRRWIDRLLGRNEHPLNLGDGFVEGLAPGIAESFARGLANPPIVHPEDPRYRIDVDFDLLNPAQRRHMAAYVLDRIVAITDEQRESIRHALQSKAVMQGIGPYDVARTIKEAIGLTPYQRGLVESYRRQLNELDPRALQRELRDKRFDRTVRGAIEANEPLDAEQVDRMTDGYHRKFVAFRAQTIARTETLRAESYGGLARVQDVLDRHSSLDVTKRWLATKDNRTRDTHRDLNGKEVNGMLTPFITSAGNSLKWPLDENGVADEVIRCRCTLQYIFKPKHGELRAVAA